MDRRDFIKNSAILAATVYMPIAKSAIHDQRAISLSGEEMILHKEDILDFMYSFQGSVISEGHYDYDTARLVWNGVWDKKPALIAFAKVFKIFKRLLISLEVRTC